jgi:formate dehydrogenase subunit gamma
MMKMVEKASFSERVNHWVLMLSFFVLFLTGFGFAFQGTLGWINVAFGGVHVASFIHRWVGLIFLISVLFTIGSYLGEALKFGPEDSDWIAKRGGYLGTHEPLMPQGRLNLGQKLFYLLVLLGGLVIWLVTESRGVTLFAHILHNLAFFAFVIAVPIHIYLATAANPGTFRVMTRGTVPLEWARKRHGKWVKEQGLD